MKCSSLLLAGAFFGISLMIPAHSGQKIFQDTEKMKALSDDGVVISEKTKDNNPQTCEEFKIVPVKILSGESRGREILVLVSKTDEYTPGMKVKVYRIRWRDDLGVRYDSRIKKADVTLGKK